MERTGILLLDEAVGIVNPSPDEKEDAERFVCVIFVYKIVGLSITVFFSNFFKNRFMI